MATRELMDSYRQKFVTSSYAPTRAIIYTRSSDETAIPLDAFVSGIDFNQIESDDKRVRNITCAGLILEQEPTQTDIITYNGKNYVVREWDESGNVYTVIADFKKNKTSTRRFK